MIILLLSFSLFGHLAPNYDYETDYEDDDYEIEYDNDSDSSRFYEEYEWLQRREADLAEIKNSPGSTKEYEAWVEKAKANPPTLCLPEITKEKK